MSNIATKLTYLNGTKQAIKQAINEDFEVIDNNTTFREYAEEISSNNAKYKDLIPKETKNATNTLDISNSSGLDKVLVTQYGNTYQETTTGANILPQDKYIASTTKNNITFTNNGDGTFNLSGTASANTTIEIIPNGNLQLEANQPYYLYSSVPYNITTFNMSIAMTDNGATKYLLANRTHTPTTTPTNERLQFYIASGQSINATNVKIMLIKGSSAPSDYEPYTNGASPNPDYPQEIVNISGKSTLKDVGKNLFDIADGTYKSNDELASITFTNGVMTNFTYSQASSFGIQIPLRTPITLTANQSYTRGNNSGMSYPYITLCNQNEATIDRMESSDNGVRTYTPTEQKEVYYIYLWFDYRLTYTNFKPMMNLGSEVSAYEPYKEQSFDLDLKSKNLFDKDNETYTSAYISDSSATTLSPSTYNRTLYIKCKPGTTYTIQKMVSVSYSRFFIASSVDIPAVSVNIYNVMNAGDNSTKATYTTSNNAKYLLVNYIQTNATTTTVEEMLNSIMINEGSTPIDYEPFYDINLCKIDTYKDRIYPLNGKWYLEKKIGKVVLDGSESGGRILDNNQRIAYNSVANPKLADVFIDTPDSVSNLTPSLSTHFSPTMQGRITTTNNSFGFSQWGGQKYIYISAIYDNIEDFKTWLTTHNLIVYYVLETPITTEITESNYPTLYNQLNNIKLFEGVNHITMTNESGLDVEFDITYYKDWKLD